MRTVVTALRRFPRANGHKRIALNGPPRDLQTEGGGEAEGAEATRFGLHVPVVRRRRERGLHVDTLRLERVRRHVQHCHVAQMHRVHRACRRDWLQMANAGA